MVDQRIVSLGRTFIGTHRSTFTGYVDRMRGYHSQKEKLRGWEDGIVDSYIFAPLIAKNQMRKYTSVEFPMWAREFPISWRDLDHDLLPHVEPTEGVVKPSNHMDASGINGVKPNADMPVVPTTQGNQMDSLKTTLNAENKPQDHRVAGLNCERYGGPSEKIAAEMIYWEDIPRDAQFVSPYATYGKTPKYLTFEPDVGGWNNVRMAMETATVLAQAMGRILVLPPEQTLWNLDKEAQQGDNQFTFRDFFHFDSIAAEYPAVEIISMEEFFKREALTGGLTNRYTGKVELPPFAVSSWNGHFRSSTDKWMWLRNVTTVPIWSYDDCVVGFPAAPGPEGVRSLEAVRARIPAKDQPWVAEFGSGITAVDAAPIDRLREVLDTRRNMCIYDEKYQNEKVIHFMGESDLGARLLVHFYGYLFFEDHHRDLRTKRFVRDHLRYVDEIQCAAARIVDAVRQKAIENGDPNGIYDSFHIRRGDFETIFPYSFVSAEEIYENTKDILVPNSTVFIATDEQNATYFDPLRKHYHLLFLDDFRHLLGDLNKNYLGMVDQREASRGRTFVGTHYSSFSGYVNRMRGYHSQKEKLPGWEEGIINSYSFAPLDSKNEMRKYTSVRIPMWAREFPASWRDLDHDLVPDMIESGAIGKQSSKIDVSRQVEKPSVEAPGISETRPKENSTPKNH